jgi:hypothetical protein
MKLDRFLLVIFCLFCMSGNILAQTDSLEYKNKLRFSGGYMHNNIFRFTELETDKYLKDGIAFEYGFSYAYPMDNKLWMGIGLSYLSSTNTKLAPVLKTTRPTEFTQVAEMVYIPVFWEYNFTQWFAFKFGMSIEIALSNSDYYNQNGLGFFAGTVFHYSPNQHIDFGIEPLAHVTAMLPIPQEFFQQHFLLIGANAYISFWW